MRRRPSRMGRSTRNLEIPPDAFSPTTASVWKTTNPIWSFSVPRPRNTGSGRNGSPSMARTSWWKSPCRVAGGSRRNGRGAARRGENARDQLAPGWWPGYITAKRLIDEGVFGKVLKFTITAGIASFFTGRIKSNARPRRETQSWFYKPAARAAARRTARLRRIWRHARHVVPRRSETAGSNACVVDQPTGLEVDEHSVTVCRYAHGLSKIETRWGTFHRSMGVIQPQPRCGFVVTGTRWHHQRLRLRTDDSRSDRKRPRREAIGRRIRSDHRFRIRSNI